MGMTAEQESARSSLSRVLLADDSLHARTYLRAILLSLPVTVEEAADGGEAFCILLDREFDLLITDLNMAPVTGAQLVMAVRLLPADRRPRIIVHTADSAASVRAVRQIIDPADRVLTKPASVGELIAAVNALLPHAAKSHA